MAHVQYGANRKVPMARRSVTSSMMSGDCDIRHTRDVTIFEVVAFVN